MLTLASMRSLVRTLTAVSATDILTDALLNQLLNESLFEIYRRQGAGWPFSQTALSTDGSTPPFDAQFHMAVVYRTAAKVLTFIADTTPRGQVFTAEYDALLSDMEKFYLPKLAAPDLVGLSNFGKLAEAVRNLSGIYDRQLLSDGMLEEIINVAYTEFTNLRDWHYFTTYIQLPIIAAPWVTGDDKINAAGWPAHRLVLDSSVATPYPGQPGDKHIREIYLISGGIDGRAERMVYTDSLNETEHADDKIFYTVTTANETNARVLYFAPQQYDNDSYIRIVASEPTHRRIYDSSYMAIDPETEEETEIFVTTFFEIPPQFQMLLVYRAAQFILMQLSPEDQRIALFEQMYGTMLQSFINYDQLSHDSRSFSIGERGKDSPRYVPWFKPA